MAYKKTIMLVLSIMLMSWMATQEVAGQSCVEALIPCQKYLTNSTIEPTKECCDPLKKALETQLPCLCEALKNPLLGANYNITQLSQLPTKCGIKNVGPSLCSDAPASSPSGSTTPTTPSTSTPPPPPSDAASSPSGSTTPTTPPTSTPPPPPSGNGCTKGIAVGGLVSSLMLILSMFY